MASVSWPGHLRNHPRLWSEDDGKVVLAALEERYNAIIAENAVQDVLSLQLEGGDEDVIKGYEGGKKLILVNHYERDANLRKEAIRIHGTTCKACGFNFAKVYGPRRWVYRSTPSATCKYISRENPC